MRCAVWAGFWLTLGGCALPHRVGLTETGAPRYERVAINYDVHGMHSPLATQAHRPVQMVDLTHLDEGALCENGWARAQLKVEYPHPEGQREMARATLRLSRRPPENAGTGWWFGQRLFARGGEEELASLPVTPITPGMQLPAQRNADDEIWILDFPRQQLDLVLVDVANSGFFDEQIRPSGGAQLSIQIDRGTSEKPWSSEPRLEDLIDRVRREGWLAGFTPANGGSIQQTDEP